MQCITEKRKPEVIADGICVGDVPVSWDAIFACLPAELEEQGYKQGAMSRRRAIRSAADLLKLLLVYVVMDWSLRSVGIWSLLHQVAELSDVAILKRLRQCAQWLEQLVAHLLSQRVSSTEQHPVHYPICHPVRLRLCDATSISCPGSKGTDWRVHVSLNLGEMRVDQLTLTDVKGGEGLQHFTASAGDIFVADRAYGYVNSLSTVLEKGACVVRVRWTDLATYPQHGEPFQVIRWLRHTFTEAVQLAQEVELLLSRAEQAYRVRLLACPLPAAEAERARKRLRKQAHKRQSKPTAESLLVAGYVLLVTNLPLEAWSAAQVSELYRLRWQVELYFKRLKRIMHLDHLRAHGQQLARTYLLGKLLLALLLDHIVYAFVVRVPQWSLDRIRPLSTWRLTACIWHGLQGLIAQQLLYLLMQVDPKRLQRYLCDAPRTRQQQATLARLLIRSLSLVNVLPA